MSVADGELEPRMNVISYSSAADGYVTIVMPRAQHRPACYFANDVSQRLVSPGALDMAGLMVTPRECDFQGITADEAMALLREVAITDNAARVIVEKLKN